MLPSVPGLLPTHRILQSLMKQLSKWRHMASLLHANDVALIERDRNDMAGIDTVGVGKVNEPVLPLRVLFLVSAHNGLSQRAHIALSELGHEVTIAIVDRSEEMEAAVDKHDPELIVCPFLKTMIPDSIW